MSLNIKGEGLEVLVYWDGEYLPTDTGPDWDWNDDDETQIRVSMYVKRPKGL